jgi:hypothetical protein
LAIITKGLGSTGMITLGYSWWGKIKEVVQKVLQAVKRFIPTERKPFKVRIGIRGSPVFSFSRDIRAMGDTAHSKKISLPVSGSFIDSFVTSISTVGNLSISVQDTLSIQGSSVLKYYEKLHCEGKKDFKKIIWTILEDE